MLVLPFATLQVSHIIYDMWYWWQGVTAQFGETVSDPGFSLWVTLAGSEMTFKCILTNMITPNMAPPFKFIKNSSSCHTIMFLNVKYNFSDTHKLHSSDSLFYRCWDFIDDNLWWIIRTPILIIILVSWPV